MNVIVERVVDGTEQLVRVALDDTAVELTLVETRILIEDLDEASLELDPCSCGHGLAEHGEFCGACADAGAGAL